METREKRIGWSGPCNEKWKLCSRENVEYIHLLSESVVIDILWGESVNSPSMGEEAAPKPIEGRGVIHMPPPPYGLWGCSAVLSFY
jgi:hypothetical protein